MLSFEYVVIFEVALEFGKQFLFVASAGAAQFANIFRDGAVRTFQPQSFKL